MTIRVNHTTVTRRGFGDVHGYAAKDGECPYCGIEVLEDEPIVLRGSQLAWDETESKRIIDLSDAEWVCQACAYPALADQAEGG